MNLRDEITSLLQLGVQLQVEGDELLIRAPGKLLTPEHRTMLKENKSEILQLLSDPENGISLKHPLSYGQKGVLFHYRLAPDNPAYNIKCALHIQGDLNLSIIEKALKFIVDRHAVLRTLFEIEKSGEAVQKVFINRDVNFKVVDASTWSEEDCTNEINKHADMPFDIENEAVFRFILLRKSANENILLLLFHHIVFDLWSFEIMLRELGFVYKTLSNNQRISLPLLKQNYTDFVYKQLEMIQTPQIETDVEFWKKELEGELPILRLPYKKKRSALQTFEGDALNFPVTKSLYTKLKSLALNEDVTLFVLMLSVYNVFLSRYTGLKDIIVGVPTVGRKEPVYQSVVGYFTNILALRLDLSGDPTFRSLVSNCRRKVLNAFEHQYLPFPLLVQRLKTHRDASTSPVFQVSFTWERGRQTVSSLTDQTKAGNSQPGISQLPFNLKSIDLEQRGATFDLDLSFVDDPENCFGIFRYNNNLFAKPFIQKMADQMVSLLESVVEAPDKNISLLKLLTSDEEHSLIHDRNQVPLNHGVLSTIHTLFENQVEVNFGKTAVVFDDRELSYEELNRRSNKLARYLQEQGIQPESLIPVCLERSENLLIALLSILKAGCAYLPLDPVYPKERLEYMINQTDSKIVLTQDSLKQIFNQTQAEPVLLDKEKSAIDSESADNLNLNVENSQLCYVIFTSGSTGKPKGISIMHKGVTNCLTSIQNSINITSDDILLAVTSISFDIAVLELFMPLMCGATVVIADKNTALEPNALMKKIDSSCVTFMQATPSTWKMLIDADWQGDKNLKILSGGEELPPDLAQHLIGSGKELWNMYGPTETTIWSAIQHIEKLNNGKVSLGSPLANTMLYVLDDNLNPVPDSVAGELYIAGEGLAQGYFDQPELTDEKFIPDPFNQNGNGLMFKTGDMVRYSLQGELEYLGRIDLQVKVRGYRIELEEIENILRANPLIQDSAVTVLKDQNNNPQIVAFLIAQSGKDIENNEIRTYLRKSLPEYMVPAKFIVMDKFPLTLNGKLDRAVLAKSDTGFVNNKIEYRAPESAVEKRLVEIWQRVLKVERIGVDDNFFELGGASNQALEMIAIAADNGFDFDPEQIFQYQTIAELSKFIETHNSTNPIIESLGVYLPEKSVPFKEFLLNCKTTIKFPLRRLAGIESVRMAADNEFAIDLAIKAMETCFANSKYKPNDIDLIISCNITRLTGHMTLAFEPSFAMKLSDHFKMKHVLTFDISNACAGMWTGIWVVNQFIQSGQIRRGMVVSGEYITHCLQTSQKEIEEYMDSRLACLTLGDAGAAVIIEAAQSKNTGFQDLELYTMGKYSKLCIAQMTNKDHGGIIMYTDLLGLSNASSDEGVKHSKEIIDKNNLDIKNFDHLILHQTSKTTLNNTTDKINQYFGENFSNKENTINNITNRGNTATTTHMVALWDNIHNNRINNGDKIILGISGSGITTGTALYVMDDLPDRLRNGRNQDATPSIFSALHNNVSFAPKPLARVSVRNIGVVPANINSRMSVVELARMAGEACFEKSEYKKSDIDLLIYTGVYREQYLCEPAVGALIAGELEIERGKSESVENNVLVFDIFNGTIGFFNACHLASQAITTGSAKTVMIISGEIENNANIPDKELLGLKETASAIILSKSTDDNSGFGKFVFKSDAAHIDALQTNGIISNPPGYLQIKKSPDLELAQIDCLLAATQELLQNEDIDLEKVKIIIPPQISSSFIKQLAGALHVTSQKFIDVTEPGFDLYSSSLPYALKNVIDTRRAAPGDIGLVMSAGSGIQACCASYYF